MSKKDFIALADIIKQYNQCAFDAGSNISSPLCFTHTQILALADFCKGQNYAFNRERWLDYIADKCGPNGGAIEQPRTAEHKTRAKGYTSWHYEISLNRIESKSIDVCGISRHIDTTNHKNWRMTRNDGCGSWVTRGYTGGRKAREYQYEPHTTRTAP